MTGDMDGLAEDGDIDLAEMPALGRWIKEELQRLNAKDGEARGPQWVADNAIDPATGKRPLGRVSVSNYFTRRSTTDLKPGTYRALANCFGVPRHHVRDLVALDIGCADENPRGEWPYWLPPEAKDLSADGRHYMRRSGELVCREEGLID